VNRHDTVDIPRMLLIGSAERNAGKTEFSCRILKAFGRDRDIIAVKVTAIDKTDGTCPRGGKGCGVCSSLKGTFDITEETDAKRPKDTSRLLDAGASKVLWLRVLKSHMREGLMAVMDLIGKDAVWLCESNSIRSVVKPGVFLMAEETDSGNYKASAKMVAHHVDCKVRKLPESNSFAFDFERLSVCANEWALKEDAAVIILAGGESVRMGTNKSLLPVLGQTMIEHIVSQVRRHFAETIISAASKEEYLFLDLPVAVDFEPGQGPLVGIATALERSAKDLNFVTTCDVPDIDMPTVRNMLHLAKTENKDIVVPRHGDGHIEPLYAVYHRRVAPSIRDLLKEGERKVRALFDKCDVGYYDLPEQCSIDNINTREEYDAYCERNSAK
jgi:molybdopterin-guanine dinucleotide biosynthesis protein A